MKVIPLGLDAGRAPALASALAEVGPDVVHVNLVNPASNRAALRAAQACAPTVATLHDGGTSPGLRELYSNLAAAVAVSAKIARQLRDDLGVPASAIHRIRNGVDLPPRVARPAETTWTRSSSPSTGYSTTRRYAGTWAQRARLRALRDFDAGRMVTETMRVLARAAACRSAPAPEQPTVG